MSPTQIVNIERQTYLSTLGTMTLLQTQQLKDGYRVWCTLSAWALRVITRHLKCFPQFER